MWAAVQTLRERDVQDLRAIYDSSHEARRQRGCTFEALGAAEALSLAGVSAERAAEIFDLRVVTTEILCADLRADERYIEDAKPMRDSLAQSYVEFGDRLAQNDPVENGLIAQEMMRRASLAHGDRMLQREVWELQTLVLEVDNYSPIEDHQRLAVLTRVDAVQRLRLLEMYESILLAFGLRPVEPLTTTDFVAGTISTLEGVMMGAQISGPAPDMMRPTGPNGQLRQWSMLANMFEAFVLASVEADPFSNVAIDLSVWR